MEGHTPLQNRLAVAYRRRAPPFFPVCAPIQRSRVRHGARGGRGPARGPGREELPLPYPPPGWL